MSHIVPAKVDPWVTPQQQLLGSGNTTLNVQQYFSLVFVLMYILLH